VVTLSLPEDRPIAAQDASRHLLVDAPSTGGCGRTIVEVIKDEDRHLGGEPAFRSGLMTSRKGLRALREALALALALALAFRGALTSENRTYPSSAQKADALNAA